MPEIDKSSWVAAVTLADQAERIPDRPFLAYGDGPAITFGQLDETVRRLANGLARLGVGQGDRVLVMLPNCPEFVQVWLAVSRLGAVLVPVNTAYKGHFFEHVANDCGAALIVIDTAYLEMLAASEDRVPKVGIAVVVGTPDPAPFRRLHLEPFGALYEAPADGTDVTVTCRDLGAILYTSGTTGPSKGVLLPNGHLHLNGYVYNRQLGLNADDVFYCCLPLFHANGLLLQVYGAMQLGGRVTLATSFSASRWIDDVRRCKATVTNLLGVMGEFVYRQPRRPDDHVNDLRVITAVPIPTSFLDDFQQRFGLTVVTLYGTTEVNCPIYAPLGERIPPGSCGKLVDEWFDARVVDSETDEDMPPGEVGELVVRPTAPWCFMAGYNGRPEATVEVWRNFWFHTGDAMRRDGDGYFYYVDRLKDCLRHRGENISSYEVEQVLLAHDAIAEAAVVGLPSAFDAGEQEVKACVVLRSDAELAPADLAAYCEARMPRFAVPRFIEFLPELPKTPTQKVQKQKLRDAGAGPDVWDRLEHQPPLARKGDGR